MACFIETNSGSQTFFFLVCHFLTHFWWHFFRFMRQKTIGIAVWLRIDNAKGTQKSLLNSFIYSWRISFICWKMISNPEIDFLWSTNNIKLCPKEAFWGLFHFQCVSFLCFKEANPPLKLLHFIIYCCPFDVPKNIYKAQRLRSFTITKCECYTEIVE